MANKKLKKVYQRSPKEKKLGYLAIPFMAVLFIIMILIVAQVGGYLILIIVDIADAIPLIIILVMMQKEHKKWLAEGNKGYRYYNPDTGEEVDENGNPLSDEPAPIREPKQEEPSLPEPDENGDIEEPAPVEKRLEPQPQVQPQQRSKYESPFVGFVREVAPIIGFGIFALVALLRTIMFIRDMVYYIQRNSFFTVHILNAIRLIGSAILLAVIIVSIVKYFKEKQKIEQGFVALLKIAFLSAIIGIVGLVYECASFLDNVYDLIDLLIQEEGSIPGVFVEMFIRNFIIVLFYVAFDIALIVFYKIALKNKVDSIKNKIFAVMPLGIMFVICIMLMIVTSVTMPGMAPGLYVTASMLMLACAAVSLIPFFVPFANEPLDQKAAVAPVAAAPVYQEPKHEEHRQAQPQKRDDEIGDPEVKSNKKGLIIILIVVAALVLCGGGGVGAYFLIKNANNQNRVDGPSDDDDSYHPSSSSQPSSKSSSSSSRSSSKSSSSSASVSKTPKEVMADICKSIYGSAKYYDDNNSDYNYWYSDSGFVTIVGWAELDESYLQDAVEFVVGKLPSYLVNIDELHSGTWSDGLNGCFQNFVSQDEQVKVEIGSYYDDSGLNCQVLSRFNY